MLSLVKLLSMQQQWFYSQTVAPQLAAPVSFINPQASEITYIRATTQGKGWKRQHTAGMEGVSTLLRTKPSDHAVTTAERRSGLGK